jgi:nucleotide-binding universal stress UspA family protein
MIALVATDGSDHAVSAARRGAALLAVDAVLLVCAVDPPAVATAGLESGFAGGLATSEEIDEAWSAVKANAQDALDRTAAALPDRGAVEMLIVDGDAGSAICELATERDADAIVIGSRGHGAVRRALLGSVSTYVVKHAPCPVVIVPPGADHDDG